MLNATFNKEEFDKMAAEWRYIITDMICRAGSGHLGGALSLVEIIITLYYRIMKIDPKNPEWDKRDRLVMLKGHAGPVLYIALAYKGFFPNCLQPHGKDGKARPEILQAGFEKAWRASRGSPDDRRC